MKPQSSDIIFYSSPDGNVHVEVIFSDETCWLTINQMADLFGTSKQNISYHLQNIYSENELNPAATVKEILTVQDEGGPGYHRGQLPTGNPQSFVNYCRLEG